MKFTRILLAATAALFITGVHAQTPVTPRPSIPGSIGPAAPRVEGTIVYEGVTAELNFEAPDKLRIETPNWIVVTDKDTTLVMENATQRARRVPWNVAREPWRGADLLSGGPANAAIFGVARSAYEKIYRPATAETGSFALQAQPGAVRRVRDLVGANAERSGVYYAVSTVPAWDVPQNFKLVYEKGALVSREETRGSAMLKAAIETDATTKLPTSATFDGKKFVYNLKPREKAFSVDTFEFPDRGAIIEDMRVPALDDLKGKDAASVLARGRIMAGHLEDLGSAVQLYNEASGQEPRATAPYFLTYEAAITARDLPLAATALDKLAETLGESPVVFVRRANIAALRRDWDGAATALEKAEETAPDEATKNQARLLRAPLLRSKGDIDGARALLVQVIKGGGAPAAEAALALTLGLTADEADTVRGLLPEGDAGELARALVDLQLNRVPKWTPPTEDATSKDALALGAGRAGRFDYAGTMAASPQYQLAIGALRGDTTSLKNFRDLLARLPGENSRNSARGALSSAWAKSFRLDELKSALDNRALAAIATSDDWRTLLNYQESRGTLEEIGTTVRAGLGRFPDAAWWHSRFADQLQEERTATPWKQTVDRARLRTDALREIERAHELDPDQIYYPMQQLLALIDAVNEDQMIRDVVAKNAFRKKAEAALAEFEVNYAGNPDAALLAALSHIALARATGDLLDITEAALASGTPELDNDRHTTTFFARQAMAMHYRRINGLKEAARQYEMLLNAARTPIEETGIAFNYLLMLQSLNAPDAAKPATPADAPAGGDGGDAPAAPAAGNYEPQAALLERLAREPWPLEAHNSMMSQMVDVLLRDRAGALPLATLLSTGNAPRQLAGARLQFEAERVFAAAAALPDAPATADRALREVQNQAQVAVDTLQEVARGADKMLAARAMLLLAEREANFKNPTEAARLLRQAIAIEPNESGLRIALADALLASKKPDDAIAVRDALVREVPTSAESLRRAASLSLRLKQPTRAVELAQAAQRLTQLNPGNTTADVETASLVLARAFWADGKADRAEELYKKLTSTQWPTADRAAALMDWIASLRASNREADADRQQALMDGLGATDVEKKDARDLLDSL